MGRRKVFPILLHSVCPASVALAISQRWLGEDVPSSTKGKVEFKNPKWS